MRRLGVSRLVWGILTPRLGSLACIESWRDGTLCGDWACHGLCGVFCPRAWDRWCVLNRGETGHCAAIGRVTACVGHFDPVHGIVGVY